MPGGRDGFVPQKVRFCQAPDGVRIAYAVHGSGPPLLISTCWLSHLQFDWESPVWRHFLSDLGRFATIVRFDERGHGLSDWDVTDHSLESRLGDLEAVADDAGLERFALMAMAQGGPVAIAYAVRHPTRVSRLLFYDSYADPLRGMTAEDIELEEAFEHLIKAGWGRPESTFRRVFTSQMIPGATEEQKTWLDDLMRASVSASTAYLARQQRKQTNATELLSQVRVPTLVLHALGDRMNSFAHGRHLASSIPGARLVPLTARTTSCFVTSRPGRCSSTRSNGFSPLIGPCQRRRHLMPKPSSAVVNSRFSPWPPTVRTTRTSRRRCRSAFGPSSGICRTFTSSSTSKVDPRAPPPLPAFSHRPCKASPAHSGPVRPRLLTSDEWTAATDCVLAAMARTERLCRLRISTDARRPSRNLPSQTRPESVRPQLRRPT